MRNTLRKELGKFTESQGSNAMAFANGAEAAIVATLASGDDDHWVRIDYRLDGNKSPAYYVELHSAPPVPQE